MEAVSLLTQAIRHCLGSGQRTHQQIKEHVCWHQRAQEDLLVQCTSCAAIHLYKDDLGLSPASYAKSSAFTLSAEAAAPTH